MPLQAMEPSDFKSLGMERFIQMKIGNLNG